MKIRFRLGPSRRRSTGASDDRGSMPMALLVTLVGTSLSAVLVPVVVNQIISTRTLSARTHALDAALAGIDAAVGQLRAATITVSSGVGDLAALPPCAITGSQAVGGLRYSVILVYRLAGGTPSATCPPATVPVTATLTATGTGSPTGLLGVGSPGTRTVEATYTFNNAGGSIQLAVPRPNNQLCLDSGNNAFPAAGTPATAELCTGGSSDQRFAYTVDHNIKLVASETGAAPAGMCLEAPLAGAVDHNVTFQPCLGPFARQQWTLNGSSNFQGTYDGTQVTYCITARNAGVPGSAIRVDNCNSPVLQQWNVPANFTEPAELTNFMEK